MANPVKRHDRMLQHIELLCSNEVTAIQMVITVCCKRHMPLDD